MGLTGYFTLMDLAKRNGSDQVVGLIDETTKDVPELRVGAARTIKGIQYKTRVRTGLPTVGFRDYNEGVALSKGRIENRLIECFLMNPPFEIDKALADVSEDGPEMLLADEAIAMVTAAMQKAASQFYYGTATDGSKGFPGLIVAVDAAMVLDATGTTANTGSSVWGVKWGRQDVQWVWGNEQKPFEVSDVMLARAVDGANNPLTVYRQEMTARPGLQVGSKWSCGRIKNLTADNGKGLTDALIGKFISLFPVGKEPDMLLATKRSLEQLRASRTATNATGAEAPMPTEVHGIPVFPTEALTNTEAIA